jgi:hypothetical protein
MLAAIAALIGSLIVALAFADNVGIGPRHVEWRQLWTRRLRPSSWRFTPEALGAGAARARDSLRQLQLRGRRWWSRHQPISR